MPPAVLGGVRVAMEIEALSRDAVRLLCLAGESRLFDLTFTRSKTWTNPFHDDLTYRCARCAARRARSTL